LVYTRSQTVHVLNLIVDLEVTLSFITLLNVLPLCFYYENRTYFGYTYCRTGACYDYIFIFLPME